MRQRVASLGATIDTATPDEVETIVRRALDDRQIQGYDKKRGNFQLSAGGTGQSESLKVPSQFDWFMERICIGGGANAQGALIEVYENDPLADTNMLEVILLPAAGASAGKYSDSFSNDIYVPANSQVIITATGGPANGQVTFALQIRIVPHRGRQVTE